MRFPLDGPMRLKRMIIALLMALAVLAMVLGDLGSAFAQATPTAKPVHVAQAEPSDTPQPKKRKTLFDMLFGNDDEDQQQDQPQVQKKAPPPKAALPAVPEVPPVEKAANATRLSVFGDSMAIDVGKALERFYAEDPNLIVQTQGVGNSGLVRPDYFDWKATIADQISKQSFDIAVILIGINDRQTMNIGTESYKSLTPEWSAEYSARVGAIVQELRAANKPVIWIGLPPMQAPKFGQAMIQVNEIQRLAAFGGGAEFLDIYERFADEDGKYAARGPDINGNLIRQRKDDGIHFSTQGADKLAYFISQSLRTYYRGAGSVGVAVTDPLAGTDAQNMLRPPYQGLGEMKLLEVAGAVISLTHAPRRAAELVTPATAALPANGFDMDQLINAPVGRADAFWVGKVAEPDTTDRQ